MSEKIIYLTTLEAAIKLRCSKQVLLRWLRKGIIAFAPRMAGAKMLWIESEIDSHLAVSFYTPPESKSKSKRTGRPSKKDSMIAAVS